jgi:hypothetical protein
MGREDNVVRAIGNAVQICGFPEELYADRYSRWRVWRSCGKAFLPQGFSGEVDVVDSTHRWIDRKHPVSPEATARSPDFEAPGTISRGHGLVGERRSSTGQ